LDLTWLFLLLCPYTLMYFYLFDITKWSHVKVNSLWLIGFIVIFGGWLLINYYIPNPSPFPALFKSA
jgi:hypothetical protein